MTTNATSVEGQPVEQPEPEVIQEATALTKMPVEPGSLLAIIKEAAVNKADAETMRELLNVWKDAKADQAAEAFAEALVQFRRGVRPIIMTGLRDDTKTKNSRDEYGTVKYPYAELTTTIEQIQPVLDQCQLTPTWRMTKNEMNYVELECIVTHILKHKESSGPFGSPVGEGRRGQTPVQVRQGVVTSLKRATLFMVLGLTTKEDDRHLQNAEQGAEDKKPRSPADPEAETKTEFWKLAKKKMGVELSRSQAGTIFLRIQEASGKDSAAECLAYLAREDIHLSKEGVVSVIMDESPEEIPAGEAPDFQATAAADNPQDLQSDAPAASAPQPPSFHCDTCGEIYPVKTANNKCLTKGCKGTVKTPQITKSHR